ncbi:Calcium-transporting ATPase 1 [Granulosicoccus antarcticus IMCC3135]|uniref:Calcium-transporting ATPase 1 n=1 Tax=Granulosicoccus antarcticus IMCC3135 TaxID=1192854 RepID=A0A2Z2NV91_9GAMM|nr:Calcium-transporting ATPase 1 [Granulosicoccus antarcticus IMCC3135]
MLTGGIAQGQALAPSELHCALSHRRRAARGALLISLFRANCPLDHAPCCASTDPTPAGRSAFETVESQNTMLRQFRNLQKIDVYGHDDVRVTGQARRTGRKGSFSTTPMPDPESQKASPKDPSLIDFDDLVSSLGTNLERGLDAGEAAKRLRADGPNELRALPPVPVWRRALAQLQNPLVYLLGIAAAVALAAWWFDGRSQPDVAGWPLDAIVIICVVVLNAVLGWLQEAKTAQAVAALAKMTTSHTPRRIYGCTRCSLALADICRRGCDER